MTAFILAQIAGVMISVFAISAYMQKRKRNVIICDSCICIFEMIQFALLGAVAGTVIGALNFIRNSILYRWHGRGREAPIWFAAIFVVAITTGGVLSWEHWFDIFPIVGAATYSYALCQKNMTFMRFAGFTVSACYVVYGFYTMAFAGAIGSMLEVIVVLVAIGRYDVMRGIRYRLILQSRKTT